MIDRLRCVPAVLLSLAVLVVACIVAPFGLMD